MKILSENFWDCECETGFIHANSIRRCYRCGAIREEQPRSRKNEVAELEKVSINTEEFIDWYLENNGDIADKIAAMALLGKCYPLSDIKTVEQLLDSRAGYIPKTVIEKTSYPFDEDEINESSDENLLTAIIEWI